MMFNAEMVRAILDGRKTQTRLIMKNQPCESIVGGPVSVRNVNGGYQWFADDGDSCVFHCPIGAVGDRLWVRETFGDCGERLVYRADTDDGAQCKVKRWTPSIHMPRWSSRITLEITGVRVERLNDISAEDAAAEGITGRAKMHDFGVLWSSIYGDESWLANPWVWVIEFKRVEAVKGNAGEGSNG